MACMVLSKHNQLKSKVYSWNINAIKFWGNLKNESVERQIVELKNHNSAILFIHV